MDAEQIVRDVSERVRELVSQAEEKAAEIVSAAEQDAKRIRAQAEEEARTKLDEVRRALERLEQGFGGGQQAEVVPEPVIVPEPAPAPVPEPTPEPVPEPAPEPVPEPTPPPGEADPPQVATSSGKPTTEELIEKLKAGSAK